MMGGGYTHFGTKKRELDRSIDQLRDLRQPPLELSRPDVIHRFQQLLKDALRSPDRRLAKGYLRLLVDRVVVHPVGDGEAEIEVITKGTGAVALMATSRSSVTPVLTAEGAVHTSVGGWLPEGLPCKNRFSNLPLPTSRYPERADSPLLPPMIVLLLNRAEEFRRLLDSGAVRNQADLARMFCLTRARVTQLLQLLDLEPSIRAYAKSLSPGTPTNMVTERELRVLLKLPSSVQLQKAKRTVQGFSEYLTGIHHSTDSKLLDDDLVQTRVALLSLNSQGSMERRRKSDP